MLSAAFVSWLTFGRIVEKEYSFVILFENSHSPIASVSFVVGHGNIQIDFHAFGDCLAAVIGMQRVSVRRCRQGSDYIVECVVGALADLEAFDPVLHQCSEDLVLSAFGDLDSHLSLGRRIRIRLDCDRTWLLYGFQMSAGGFVEKLLIVAENGRIIIHDGRWKTVDRVFLAEIALKADAEIVAFVDTDRDEPSGKPFVDLVQALGHVRTIGAPGPCEIEDERAAFDNFRLGLGIWFRLRRILIFLPIGMDSFA